MIQPENVKAYDLERLKLWEENPHRGVVAAIKKSFVRYGYNGALRIWSDGESDTVMGGNHSLKALLEIKAGVDAGDAALIKQLKQYNKGKARPAGVILKSGRWFVAGADISHLTWREAVAFAVADNHTAELAENDPQQLVSLLTDIAANEDTSLLDAISYTQTDIDALLEDLNKGGQGDDLETPGDASSNEVPDVWGVVVECEGEEQQTALLERLLGEGYKCRALLS